MFRVGQRVCRSLTGELGTVLEAHEHDEGSVHAIQYCYKVSWDAGGQPEGQVYESQLQPA